MCINYQKTCIWEKKHVKRNILEKILEGILVLEHESFLDMRLAFPWEIE